MLDKSLDSMATINEHCLVLLTFQIVTCLLSYPFSLLLKWEFEATQCVLGKHICCIHTHILRSVSALRMSVLYVLLFQSFHFFFFFFPSCSSSRYSRSSCSPPPPSPLPSTPPLPSFLLLELHSGRT